MGCVLGVSWCGFDCLRWVWLGSRRRTPFPPARVVGRLRWRGLSLGEASVGIGVDWQSQHALTDMGVVLKIRPAPGQLDDHAPRSLANSCGDFDQPCAPSAGMPFAQRITFTTTIEVMTARTGQQCLP